MYQGIFKLFLFYIFFFPLCPPVIAQDIKNNPKSNHGNKFEQLGSILPDPNVYRTASGAPGPNYWQQRADYVIDAKLDEKELKLYGRETVTYYNNSPDLLDYLWFQLDENEHDPNSANNFFDGSNIGQFARADDIKRIDKRPLLAGHGVNIDSVNTVKGAPLRFTINQTMMRVDLPKALKPGEQIKIRIVWDYKIPNRKTVGGRGGYEYFEEDGNHLFTIAQWFPRLCVYSDFQGWQNKQFTGRGEFALTFGNYDVRMTVPADHLVAATGECQNYAQVLSPARLARYNRAQTAKDVIEVGTLDEAKAAEKTKATLTKTWHFKANMVRDFAWTSSRKYIWDAMPVSIAGKKVMCMSFYPRESYSLYRRYSTKVVAHTIKSYSRFTIDYPYPVAQSIEADNGMEYPMICFNYGRTERDGTYSEATKYGMIGVIIHEVGHNFFPMIINSDERQWSWMDEGLNTFTQYLTEELFDPLYPSQRGPAYKIVDYMKLPVDQLEPIMTNSENIIQFGPNAYAKPATGLNILRETIMGRELFDFAFKTYAKRWAFKHPTPADFFRTMEDASAVDLDWFWRGWFYGIEPCDISLDSVKFYIAATGRGYLEARDTVRFAPQYKDEDDLSKERNIKEGIVFPTDTDTSLQDFYWKWTRGKQSISDTGYQVVIDMIEGANQMEMGGFYGKYIYELSLSNKGGLVMPVIVQWTFADGTKEIERIPVEIWRKNEFVFTKVFIKNKKITEINIDPRRETADIDRSNNLWPHNALPEPSAIEIYKGEEKGRRSPKKGDNPMQRQIN